MVTSQQQEAQLLQKGHKMLHTIEYFAKKIQGRLKSFEMTPLSRACESPLVFYCNCV